MSPVGFGCWQYGNKFLWNYDEVNDDELKRVFEYSCGIRNIWFDTAEVYGKDHRSENLLGKFLSSSRHGDRRPLLLTKCAPQILKIGKESLISSGKKSLSRLGTDAIDLYQLHWPPTPALWQEKEYIQGLADLVEMKKVKEVGVSNYGPIGLKRVFDLAKASGGNIVTDQVQCSLLAQNMLQNGLLETCKELGVTPLSYSPLALGLLADKYTEDRLPAGVRGILFREFLPSMKPLLQVMRAIAKERGKTVAQVALNWNLCKGFLVLVGTRTVEQAKDNLGASTFRLSDAEIDEIEIAANKAKRFIKNPQECV